MTAITQYLPTLQECAQAAAACGQAVLDMAEPVLTMAQPHWAAITAVALSALAALESLFMMNPQLVIDSVYVVIDQLAWVTEIAFNVLHWIIG